LQRVAPMPPAVSAVPPAARPTTRSNDMAPQSSAPSTRQEELRSFLFLAIVMAPVLAIIIVGGYGFAVWMFQLLTGQLPTA